MRIFLGGLLIKAGVAILPRDVRDMLRGILLYRVPGALSEAEKAEVRAGKAAMR